MLNSYVWHEKKQSHVLGIDIGGSGIKGALVDTVKGELVTERHRIPTPKPSTPDAVANVVNKLVEHFSYKGSVGCTFPAIVRRGVVYSAANVDKSWIGTDADALFEEGYGAKRTHAQRRRCSRRSRNEIRGR